MAKKIKNIPNKVDSEETENLKNQLARALADYDNLKRRTEEEKINWIKFSSQTIILKSLTILDMLEKAQEHLKDSGLAIAILEFKKLLIDEGVEEINPEIDSEFDENTMEAIEITKGTRDNIVSEVIQTGWKYKEGNQIVRYAKVKVTKK